MSQYTELDGIFSDKEAWMLFRLAAFSETLGWALLITGIIFKKFTLFGYEFVLPIAGSIHGVFFIFYILIVLFAHRSLHWRLPRFIAAELLANIPFGALFLERIVAKERNKR